MRLRLKVKPLEHPTDLVDTTAIRVPLDGLPIEVIEVVAESLWFKDLCRLRLTCRELNRKTYHCFGVKGFATTRTDLSRQSLEKLRQRSREQAISREFIQTLRIDKSSGYGVLASHKDLGLDSDKLISRASMLQEILVEGLVNCRSFHVCGYAWIRSNSELNSLTHTDVIGIILTVIADAKLAVKSFVVDNLHSRFDQKDQLQFSQLQQPDFLSGWANLEELVIGASITSQDMDWVPQLVLGAPRLQKLSLAFRLNFTDPHVDFSKFGHGLQHLQYFELTNKQSTRCEILDLLSNSSSCIRELRLSDIQLLSSDNWETMIRDIKRLFPLLSRISLFWLRESTPGADIVTLFPSLADNPQIAGSEQTAEWNIKSDCRVLQPSGLPVELTYKKYFKAVRVAGVDYHGSKMETFLEILWKSVERYQRGIMQPLVSDRASPLPPTSYEVLVQAQIGQSGL